MKYLNPFILFSFVIFLYACPLSEREIIDYGQLPDSLLNLVPYRDGETYNFTDPSGEVIQFQAFRELVQIKEPRCPECFFGPDILFEQDFTMLKTESDAFNVTFTINNEDSTYINFQSNIGKNIFPIPLSREAIYDEFVLDSLYIDSIIYRDILKIPTRLSDLYKDPINPDSMYYNFENGIIKIIMSDGGCYTIAQ